MNTPLPISEAMLRVAAAFGMQDFETFSLLDTQADSMMFSVWLPGDEATELKFQLHLKEDRLFEYWVRVHNPNSREKRFSNRIFDVNRVLRNSSEVVFHSRWGRHICGAFYLLGIERTFIDSLELFTAHEKLELALQHRALIQKLTQLPYLPRRSAAQWLQNGAEREQVRNSPCFALQTVIPTGKKPISVFFDSSPQSPVLWVGFSSGELGKVEGGSLSSLIDTHLRSIYTICRASQSDALFIGGYGGLAVYDEKTNCLSNPIPDFSHRDGVFCSVGSRLFPYVYFASSDEHIWQMNIESFKKRMIAPSGESTGSLHRTSVEDTLLYTANSDCGICDVESLDLKTLERTQLLSLNFQDCMAAYSPDAQHYVVIDHYVRYFSRHDNTLLWAYSPTQGRVTAPENSNYELSCRWSQPFFSPDGQFLFCVSPVGQLCCWTAATGEVVTFDVGQGKPIINWAMDPSGERFAIIKDDYSLEIWSRETALT